MKIAHKDWRAEAVKRYGEDSRNWRFVCPCCGIKTAAGEWMDLGGEKMIAFSCIGRLKEKSRDAFGGDSPGPCNYAGGGLFRLNPIIVIDDQGQEHEVFDFADDPLAPEAGK